MTDLERLWELLRRVRRLSFIARSGSATGWNGRGVGTVEVRQTCDTSMTFNEQGTWRLEVGDRDIRFDNVYRWSRIDGVLRLEHLRFGEANPVHLFDLAPSGEREWRPVSPHVCRADCYSAVLTVCDDHIVLRWSIEGPRKMETIEYAYA